jgi:mycoredoxin
MVSMQRLRLYGHAFCPQVYTVRRELDRNDIDYEYIDIRSDRAAAERVRHINNGYESVPTLVFPDGSTMTEPATAELLDKLRSYGEQVEASSYTGYLSILFKGPGLRLIAALLVLSGIFTDLQLLTWIGLVLLAISFVLFFLKNRT